MSLAEDRFFACMGAVIIGTHASFVAVALAYHAHYLAALFTGFIASIFWLLALRQGRKAVTGKVRPDSD